MRCAVLAAAVSLAAATPAAAQSTGTIQAGIIHGEVTLAASGLPLHHASVLIPKLGRRALTDDQGRFEFLNVPVGRWDLVAHMHQLSDERKTVAVPAGGRVEVDFRLSLALVREQITVTASAREETNLESFQTVTSLGSFELTAKSGSTSLGDLLEDQPGVAKRSSGPGSTRPVVRGFDGDRVLVLEDGVRTGSLSSQSGDHGEPVEATSIERLEVVRGPATLLYGSSALGGVVNAISSHHQLHQYPHTGLRGHLTGVGGTNNGHGGSSGSFEYGARQWLFWGGGGGQRMGDYGSPPGRVRNSENDIRQANFGVGRYSTDASFSLSYGDQAGGYGVPLAPGAEASDAVDLAYRRRQARFHGSLRNLGPFLEEFGLKLNYSDWNHRELEGAEVGTQFFNRQFIYRGEFQQRRRGRLWGTFGFWGMRRDYEARGEEALTPPVDQTAAAVFAVEQVELERVRLQFGARLEHNGYDPEGLRRRSFNGLSAGAGAHVTLWRGGAFVANYTHTYRAPALEELYNRGPHAGNLTFEIGDPSLGRERGEGIDLALRQQGKRLRAEASFFYYRLGDFIYFAPTGEEKDRLPVAVVAQGGSRFVGFEARLQAQVYSSVWLNLGLDTVDAELTTRGIPLPRIPPARGRLGLDFRRGGLSLRPELALTSRQDQLAANETRTAGYAVANLTAGYTIARRHSLHVFSANLFNVADRLYRNHLSLIRQFAPEPGRGVRFSYTLHFF